MDSKQLAAQLRNPSGDIGKQIGDKMLELNAKANELTLKCLDIQPTDHVLEIGFGPGEALAEAARFARSGFVAGLDHSQTMLEVASERNKRAIVQDQIELTLGDAAHMPYADESFDKIFAVNVLHFWVDPLVELREIKRVLKPGGRVAMFLIRPETWLPGMKDSGIFHARQPEDVQKFFEEIGLNTIRIQSAPVSPGREGFCVTGEK